MRTPFAAVAAFVLGAALATSAALAIDRNPNPAPSGGQSSCATFNGVSNVVPGFWNSTNATSYVCTSWPLKCADGTVPLGNSAAISGMINEAAQVNLGYKGGKFFYTCGVPASVKPTK